jgi:multidrug efflux pump subunit AcrB
MASATFLAILFIPLFFVLVVGFFSHRHANKEATPEAPPPVVPVSAEVL